MTLADRGREMGVGGGQADGVVLAATEIALKQVEPDRAQRCVRHQRLGLLLDSHRVGTEILEQHHQIAECPTGQNRVAVGADELPAALQ